MEGVSVVRIVRQVRIIRFANTNLPNGGVPVVTQPQLPPSSVQNKRCLNAFTLLIIYIIGIGSIVLGAIHLNHCPAEKMLPVGLIAFGGMMMVSRLLNCVYDCRSVCEDECTEDIPPCLALLNLLFCLAEFGMFIAICCWAFSINPSTSPEDRGLKNYCENGLYKTSYYGCIVGIIFYALPVFCGCCFACCNRNENSQ